MKKSSTRISTLVAVGGGLATLPAAALELGEAQVNSSLGQPLRASIAYALAPNEAISGSCVSLQGGAPQSGMPAVGPATLTVADGIITINGNAAIREPLLSMRVNIRCPYTPQLSRDYMLFVDPVSHAQPEATAAVTTTAAPAVTPPATRRRPASRPAVIREPVRVASRIQVQRGDSLSEIAQSIENRPVGLWAAVDAIFELNPDAFIDSDPNKLKAGSWLSIPDFGADVSPPVVATEAVSPAPAAASAAYPGTAADAEQLAGTVEAAPATVAAEPLVAPEAQGNPVTATPATIGIPDTEIEGPVTTSTSPNVPVANIQAPPPERTAPNWLLWLAGTGIALIVALLFFGRLVRQRFASSPIGAVAPPQRRRTDGVERTVELPGAIEVIEIDDSPTHENLALDADLIVGTGLQGGNEINVAQDFGFASGGELDLELPEEMSSGSYESPPTDVIPPLNVEMQSILESEVLPEDNSADEDDYDMSVIVDATKMPLPDDATQKDLEAIPVDTGDETLITGDYTVSHEVDYKVLEQDYEDEFTATQALNNEISRAAAELAERMDSEFGSEEDTRDMSLASVTALDITAQLPANNDDVISDLDDTGVNEAITVSMRDSEKTVEMPGEDSTVEMPAKKGRSA